MVSPVDVSFTAPAGAPIYGGRFPAGPALVPGTGSIAISGYAPTVGQTTGGGAGNQNIFPGQGALTITGYAPAVSQGGSQSVVPGVGNITITGYAPQVVISGADNWPTRITQQGVVMTSRLDDVAIQTSTDGTAVGLFLLTGALTGSANVTRDTTLKAGSSPASRKFDVFNTDVATSGQIGINFSTVRTFGTGTVAWFSVRVRAPATQTYQPWPNISSGPEAHKLTIFSQHSSSNQANEVVVQNNYNAGIISGYHQDGVGFPPEQTNFASACSNTDIRWQTKIDRGANPLTGTDPETLAWRASTAYSNSAIVKPTVENNHSYTSSGGTSGASEPTWPTTNGATVVDGSITFTCQPGWSACAQARAEYGGLYSATLSGQLGQFQLGFGDPLSGCFRQYPDEWTCIIGRIQIGQFGQSNNRWTLWAEREGTSVLQMIHDSTGIKLGSGPDYDTFWMQPYTTQRVPGGTHVSSRTNNITGTTIVTTGLGCPLGNGTLTYNATTKLFSYSGNGESAGSARGYSAANGILEINVASATAASSGTVASATAVGAVVTMNTTAAHNLFTGQSVAISNSPHSNYEGYFPITVTSPTQWTYTANTAPTGALTGTATWVSYGSYLTLLVTPALLPFSSTTDTVTIATGRPNTQVNYQDAIISSLPILSPGGAIPTGVSALADAAALMSPGTWQQITGTNLGSIVTGQGGAAGSMTNDTSYWPWNPIAKRIELVGEDHYNIDGLGGPPGSTQRHYWYDDANGVFVAGTNDDLVVVVGTTPAHGFGHNQVNPFTGDVYHHKNSADINLWKSAYGTTTFGSIPITKTSVYVQINLASCWWTGPFTGQTFGPQGVYMLFNSGATNEVQTGTNGEIFCYDPTVGWVTTITQVVSTAYKSDHSPVMAYSPKYNCAVYGGGLLGTNSFQCYRLNSDGTSTRLTDVPDVGMALHLGVLAVDPVTGKFVLFSRSIWELDPTGVGTWTALPNPPVGMWNYYQPGALPSGGAPCSIPDYGVIAHVFCKDNNPANAGFWLYKHA